MAQQVWGLCKIMKIDDWSAWNTLWQSLQSQLIQIYSDRRLQHTILNTEQNQLAINESPDN